ncbi:MAG: aa3-type cytochrome c oxidase subunit IV [Alphaproteobacteria bacterium]|nr:aa3-type cytochrome c oxidase subunit IV [Pseudomonadota bacterium]TDI66754.1 MAG: aa3-type cytochrome c oxidase subunit IV [Alphaproteobacteria bacterium]
MADTDDLKAHEEMWRNFVKLLAFNAAAIIFCLAFLALVLL